MDPANFPWGRRNIARSGQPIGDGARRAGFIGETLQVTLPKAYPIGVAAAAAGGDHEGPVDLGVAFSTALRTGRHVAMTISTMPATRSANPGQPPSDDAEFSSQPRSKVGGMFTGSPGSVHCRMTYGVHVAEGSPTLPRPQRSSHAPPKGILEWDRLLQRRTRLHAEDPERQNK